MGGYPYLPHRHLLQSQNPICLNGELNYIFRLSSLVIIILFSLLSLSLSLSLSLPLSFPLPFSPPPLPLSLFLKRTTMLQKTENTSLTILVATTMRVNPLQIDQLKDRGSSTGVDLPVRCPFPASLTPPTCRGSMEVTDPRLRDKTHTVPLASTVLTIPWVAAVLCLTICLGPLHHNFLLAHRFLVIDEYI